MKLSEKQQLKNTIIKAVKRLDKRIEKLKKERLKLDGYVSLMVQIMKLQQMKWSLNHCRHGKDFKRKNAVRTVTKRELNKLFKDVNQNT